MRFRVTVGNPLPDDRIIRNNATASFFSESVGTPLTATSSANKPVGAPDLALEKRRLTNPIVAGSPVDYEIEVENVGDANTLGTVTVTDTLPLGLTVDTVSAPGWSCTITPPLPSRSFTCTRSNVARAGHSYPVISLRADTDPGLTGAVTNTATVSGGGDINFANNSGSNTTKPRALRRHRGYEVRCAEHDQRRPDLDLHDRRHQRRPVDRDRGRPRRPDPAGADAGRQRDHHAGHLRRRARRLRPRRPRARGDARPSP